MYSGFAIKYNLFFKGENMRENKRNHIINIDSYNSSNVNIS